jgi:hypothetical protein
MGRCPALRWKQKYGGPKVGAVQRLNAPEEENAGHPRLAAGQALDDQMLRAMLRKTWTNPHGAFMRVGRRVPRGRSPEAPAASRRAYAPSAADGTGGRAATLGRSTRRPPPRWGGVPDEPRAGRERLYRHGRRAVPAPSGAQDTYPLPEGRLSLASSISRRMHTPQRQVTGHTGQSDAS